MAGALGLLRARRNPADRQAHLNAGTLTNYMPTINLSSRTLLFCASFTATVSLTLFSVTEYMARTAWVTSRNSLLRCS